MILGGQALGRYALGQISDPLARITAVLQTTETHDRMQFLVGVGGATWVFGALHAAETRDTMLAGSRSFNPPVTVKVGLIETSS